MKTKLVALYKAYPPYMQVTEGHGYQGVVLHEPITDRVQCHICGRLFESLSRHIGGEHQMKVRRYKEIFGLKMSTPLWNTRLHKKKSVETKVQNLLHPEYLEKFKKSKRGKAPPKKFTVQEMNAKGTCPLQLDTLFDKIMKEQQDIPKIKHIKKYVYASICYRFGNYNKYLEYRGLVNPRKK